METKRILLGLFCLIGAGHLALAGDGWDCEKETFDVIGSHTLRVCAVGNGWNESAAVADSLSNAWRLFITICEQREDCRGHKNTMTVLTHQTVPVLQPNGSYKYIGGIDYEWLEDMDPDWKAPRRNIASDPVPAPYTPPPPPKPDMTYASGSALSFLTLGVEFINGNGTFAPSRYAFYGFGFVSRFMFFEDFIGLDAALYFTKASLTYQDATSGFNGWNLRLGVPIEIVGKMFYFEPEFIEASSSYSTSYNDLGSTVTVNGLSQSGIGGSLFFDWRISASQTSSNEIPTGIGFIVKFGMHRYFSNATASGNADAYSWMTGITYHF